MDIVASTPASYEDAPQVGESLGKELCERFFSLQSARAVWETVWQDIRLLVRPDTSDFKGERMQGLTRNDYIYDDTPCHALETLVNGLDGSLTSSFQRWFAYQTTNTRVNKDPSALAYLDQTSDIIYNKLNEPESLFPTMSHEMYAELCAFGTGVMLLDYDKLDRKIRFKAYPLAYCYLDQNNDGIIDVCFRKFKFTTRQAIQEYGYEALPDKISGCDNLQQLWEFVHCVYPRSDRHPNDPRAKNMPFASVILFPDGQHVIRESGFMEFPYLVPRWTKLAGEVYGRSPVMNCIQNIRMLNALQRVTIQAASLAAMPPVMMENEDWSTPFEWRPGFVIWGDPGAAGPKPIQLGSQPQIAQELIKFHQESIQKALFNHLFASTDYGNRERVTATEVSGDDGEKMKGIGSVVGRLVPEFLDPLHHKMLKFFDSVKELPPLPICLQGHKCSIFYLSPAARAQRQVKSQNMKGLLGSIIPLLQYAPNLADGINLPKYMQQLSIALEIDREVIRSDAEIKKIQDDREVQQQQQQYMQAANSVGGALKDTATAASKVPSLVGLPSQ